MELRVIPIMPAKKALQAALFSADVVSSGGAGLPHSHLRAMLASAPNGVFFYAKKKNKKKFVGYIL